MSMSQEEIEALMSGLDIEENDSSEVEEQDIPQELEDSDTMSEDDITDFLKNSVSPHVVISHTKEDINFAVFKHPPKNESIT